jgi:hypothetical protein
MKIFNLRTALCSTVAACLISIMPLPAFGGTIRTNIASSYEVQRSGSVSIKVDISNKGTATAFNMALALFLGKEAERHAGLGNNPPNGKIHVEIQPIDPLPGPGKYTGVLRVEFEEQGGKPHRAYHVIEIPYRMDETPSYRPRLNFRLKTPALSKKDFWRKKSEIQISMKNGYPEAITPYVSVYLPDGFTASQQHRQCDLSPGEEKWIKVPLTIDPMAKNINPYHMVVQYNLNGIHYSRHVKGMIRFQENRILFKWFALAGVTFLAILAAIICFRKQRA